MEESVFENTYPRTREVMQEVLRYIYFQSRKALAVWILDTVLIVLTLALVCWTRQWTLMHALVLGLLIGRLLSFCYSYWRGVRLMLARDREQYGEAPVEVRTALTQTGIGILPLAGEDVKIAYENIKYAAQTRHLILIFTKAKLFHMLHKDGFTKGTAEECVAFLREKGVKVR